LLPPAAASVPARPRRRGGLPLTLLLSPLVVGVGVTTAGADAPLCGVVAVCESTMGWCGHVVG
jgi:hypothetical protein